MKGHEPSPWAGSLEAQKNPGHHAPATTRLPALATAARTNPSQHEETHEKRSHHEAHKQQMAPGLANQPDANYSAKESGHKLEEKVPSLRVDLNSLQLAAWNDLQQVIPTRKQVVPTRKRVVDSGQVSADQASDCHLYDVGTVASATSCMQAKLPHCVETAAWSWYSCAASSWCA